ILHPSGRGDHDTAASREGDPFAASRPLTFAVRVVRARAGAKGLGQGQGAAEVQGPVEGQAAAHFRSTARRTTSISAAAANGFCSVALAPARWAASSTL